MLDFELATPISLTENKRINSEDLWEVPNVKWPFSEQNESKMKWKWPIFWNCFCFGHNF